MQDHPRVEEFPPENSAVQDAYQAQGRFLANMSHEMRTPLNAILGMSCIAKHTDDPVRKAYCLEQIEEAALHLRDVIGDLLDMSQIESGELRLEFAPLDLPDVLCRAVQAVRCQAVKKRQCLSLELAEDLPSCVLGDERRFLQMLNHLLGNAVKFTPEGGRVTLQAYAREKEEAQCNLVIVVRDTGIGMTEQQQQRLFRPFAQMDDGTTRRYGGTGLGLVICQSILSLAGGSLSVESELGKGSVFTAQFPARILPAQELATSSPEKQALRSFRGLRVLLAEDIEVNREVLAAQLEPMGIVVDCVENGLRAVDRFRSHGASYDAVFMDIHMPEMDGYEATRCIRALECGERRVPILALTSNAFAQDVAACKACGMDDHIAKPVDMAEVVRKLRLYVS